MVIDFCVHLKMLESLEFFDTDEHLGTVKASVHKTGRLGFSNGANKLIGFEEQKFFKLGRKIVEGIDSTYDTLYMIPVSEEDERTFKVVKAGVYYYLKTKRLLNQMGIDYKNESVIFDIAEVIEGKERYFKLTRKKKR